MSKGVQAFARSGMTVQMWESPSFKAGRRSMKAPPTKRLEAL